MIESKKVASVALEPTLVADRAPPPTLTAASAPALSPHHGRELVDDDLQPFLHSHSRWQSLTSNAKAAKKAQRLSSEAKAALRPMWEEAHHGVESYLTNHRSELDQYLVIAKSLAGPSEVERLPLVGPQGYAIVDEVSGKPLVYTRKGFAVARDSVWKEMWPFRTIPTRKLSVAVLNLLPAALDKALGDFRSTKANDEIVKNALVACPTGLRRLVRSLAVAVLPFFSSPPITVVDRERVMQNPALFERAIGVILSSVVCRGALLLSVFRTATGAPEAGFVWAIGSLMWFAYCRRLGKHLIAKAQDQAPAPSSKER